MKLLGVRFENFACFDECYVPLGKAVQILVGRNNSGKTAILRGLSLLRSLPFARSPLDHVDPVPPEIFRYARRSPAGANIPFQVEFRLDDGDENLIGSALFAMPRVRSSRKRTLSFTFRAVAAGNLVDFEGVGLALDDGDIPIVTREGSVLIHQQYDRNGAVSGRAQLGVLLHRAGSTTPNDWTMPVFAASGILAVPERLRKTRMVDAHRTPWAAANMQAVESLDSNVQNLAQFLDTISGRNRRKTDEIESFVRRVFPEIDYVNPEKQQSSLSLTVTQRDIESTIPLTHCGTGLEQVIAIAAFVLTAPRGSMLLLDEPHAYLHPTAEREVMAFLQDHHEHTYVISTHSAIMINSVDPSCIVDVRSPVMSRFAEATPSAAGLLYSLGYRNSDLLFCDRLIFVEGESDQEILPLLLAQNPAFDASKIARTGFPKMDGDGKARGTSAQTSILFFEKFVKELGRTSLPRIYLFDGDCREDARRVLRETPILSNAGATVEFLPRCELENYLLVPTAIEATVRDVASLEGRDVSALTTAAVEEQIQSMLVSDDLKVFPDGKEGEALRRAKGSLVLSRIFRSYGLRYSKRNEGRLIAAHLTAANQPALREIWQLVESLFAR